MGFSQVGQVIGLFSIMFGLFSIFARNFFWKAEQFSDRLRGKRSERTTVWDMWQVLKGVIALAVGLALLSQGHL